MRPASCQRRSGSRRQPMGRIQYASTRSPDKVKKVCRDEWICPKHRPMCIQGFARCVRRLTVTSAGRKSAMRERRTEKIDGEEGEEGMEVGDEAHEG